MDQQDFSITKSTVESYKIRHKTGLYWADINIDAQGSRGRVQIASDYGNWQNFWGACGKGGFKLFLIQIDMHYAADKFGADRYFDVHKTLEGYRSTIIEHRKHDWINAETARSLFNECKELEDYQHKEEFVMEVWQSKELLRFFETPDISYDISPQFKKFWKDVWPVFTNTLNEELSSEQPVQECDATKAQ